MKQFLLAVVCLCSISMNLRATDDENVRLDFPNAPVADVLAFYSKLIGKQIVTDNTVQGQVTVRSFGNVSSERAARLIEQSLSLNGFTLVDSADGSTVSVIGLGKPARIVGLPVFTSADDLPKAERVVSLVFVLHHVDAREMAGMLGAYSPPTSTTAFTPGRGGVLIATGQTSLLRSLVKVVEAFDVPADPADSEAKPRLPRPPIRQVSPTN